MGDPKKDKIEDITFFHPDLIEVPTDAPPYLKGWKCKKCGKVWFPKISPCATPDCWSEELEMIPLSRKGKIYSFTDMYIGQPDMKSYLPMTVAYVDLPDGIRLFSQLEGEVGSFKCEDEVEIVAGYVRDNSEGKPVTGYKFKKLS